jgi:hypothetical protein
MFFDTRNKNMYGLGVGITTVFKIAEHFLFKGGGAGITPYGHDLHTIRCSLA